MIVSSISSSNWTLGVSKSFVFNYSTFFSLSFNRTSLELMLDLTNFRSCLSYKTGDLDCFCSNSLKASLKNLSS
jgi:hypothetical protein